MALLHRSCAPDRLDCIASVPGLPNVVTHHVVCCQRLVISMLAGRARRKITLEHVLLSARCVLCFTLRLCSTVSMLHQVKTMFGALQNLARAAFAPYNLLYGETGDVLSYTDKYVSGLCHSSVWFQAILGSGPIAP